MSEQHDKPRLLPGTLRTRWQHSVCMCACAFHTSLLQRLSSTDLLRCHKRAYDRREVWLSVCVYAFNFLRDNKKETRRNKGSSEVSLKEEEVVFGPSDHLPRCLGNTWGYVRHCSRRTGTLDLCFDRISFLFPSATLCLPVHYIFHILTWFKTPRCHIIQTLFVSRWLTALWAKQPCISAGDTPSKPASTKTDWMSFLIWSLRLNCREKKYLYVPWFIIHSWKTLSRGNTNTCKVWLTASVPYTNLIPLCVCACKSENNHDCGRAPEICGWGFWGVWMSQTGLSGTKVSEVHRVNLFFLNMIKKQQHCFS